MSKPDHFNVSRRDFLKTAGVGGLASAVTAVGEAELDAQAGVRAVGPGEVPVTLMVNGKRVDLRIEPRVTLLDAVRNRADLTGNKRVCDRGTCGACTMIVDGRTVYSCSTLAIEVQGKQIRTVDGLSAAGRSATAAAADVTRSSQSVLKPTTPRAPAGTSCRKKSRRACMVASPADLSPPGASS